MKHIRRLAALCLAVMLAFCLFASVPASASGSYSIPDLDVSAVINDDGSATITETWTVDFIEGSFTRFYHDISTAGVPTDEYFSEIRDVSVSIDGVECEFTNDTSGRPDYHYNLDGTRAGARLSAYLKSEECTRTYVFRYTLDDVVKCVDHDYYLFVYRFVVKNFEKYIDTVSITVTAPNGSTPQVLYQSNGSKSVSGNRVSVKGYSNEDDMFKLRVRMDGCTISGAKNISHSDLSNGKESAEKAAKIAWQVLIRLAEAGVVLLIALSWLRNRKLKRSLEEKGLSYVRELLSPLCSVFTPVELACKIGSSDNALLLQLMSMVSSGRLVSFWDSDRQLGILIPLSTDGFNEQEAALVNALAGACVNADIKPDESGYPVNLLSLAKALRDDYDYKHEANALIFAPIDGAIKTKCRDKNVKRQVKALSRALKKAKEMNLLPTVTEKQLISSYSDHETFLFYVMTDFHGDRTVNTDRTFYDDWYYWAYFSDSMRDADHRYSDAHTSSSDSGSGCSSCSSCSSCGGGGAD